MRLACTLPMLVAVTAATALAGSRGDVEREIAGVAAHRDRLRDDREQLVVAANGLAQSLAPPSSSGRADAPLARKYREVDRLAERIDDVERRIADEENRLRLLLRRFDESALAEEQTLEARARREGAQAVATALAELAAARERLEPLRRVEVFRAPLDVALDPRDGPSELDARIAIIDEERRRVAARVVEIDREALLLATRLHAKRQWARDLGAARRDTGGAVGLLDQMHERTEATLRRLLARAEGLARERTDLLAADSRLAATRSAASEKLRTLAPRQVAP